MVVNNQKYSDVISEELLKDCIDHNPMEGFLEDYRIVHCLIRKYMPKSFFEIGTCRGEGLNVICNSNKDMWVYSLDLPEEQAHKSLQHPTRQSDIMKVGALCKFPYTQLFGDSLEFDYSKYPCDGVFIDGQHDYIHPYRETLGILKTKPKLLIYHDSDLPEVYCAILDGFNKGPFGSLYDLFRVTDTRILYAVRK